MKNLFTLAVVALALNSVTLVHAADPLPSWNDGAAKKAITAFVEKVTKTGSPDFVPPAERIATFDNDGTLWVEHILTITLRLALTPTDRAADIHPADWSAGALTKEEARAIAVLIEKP